MVLVIFDEDADLLLVSGREMRLGRNGATLMRLICGKLGRYGDKCYGELSEDIIDIVLDEGAAGVSLGALGERKDGLHGAVGWALRRTGLRAEDALAALSSMGIDEGALIEAMRPIVARLGGLEKILALLEAQYKAQGEAAGKGHRVHDGPHDVV